MTGLEYVLAGIVTLAMGGIGGRIVLPVVPRAFCKQQHVALEKLLGTQFTALSQRLERIEKKLDKTNNSS